MTLSFSSFDFDFTDGDTYKRTTIAADGLNVNTRILASAQRHSGKDVDDAGGFIFFANAANVDVAAGTFDLAVGCLSLSEPQDGKGHGPWPNERVTVNYWIS